MQQHRMLPTACCDGTVALPHMLQTCGKAFSASRLSGFSQEHGNVFHDQVFFLSKSSKNSIKVFCFAVNHRNAGTAKCTNFEALASNLETFQATSFSLDCQRACLQACAFTGHHVEAATTNGGRSSLLTVSAQRSDRCVLDDVDIGLKRPSEWLSSVSASFEEPLDTSEHKTSHSYDDGSHSPGFQGTEADLAYAIVAVASEKTDSSKMAMQHNVQHADNGSRIYSIDDDSSYHAQIPKVEEIPLIMHDRSVNVSAKKNQDINVEYGYDSEYRARASLTKGSNVREEKETLLDTRGANNDSEGPFEGFQPKEMGNDSIKERSTELESTSHSQSAKMISVCEDGQISAHVGGAQAGILEMNKQGSLMECGADVQDPAISFMADEEKFMELMESPSNVVALRVPRYHLRAHLQNSLVDSVVCLEDLGVDCQRIFRIEPRVKRCTASQIKAMVHALEGYGLNRKDAGKIFMLCPKILLLDWERDMKLVIDFFFHEVGLSQRDFPKVMRRCPKLLTMDLNRHLRPTLKFLRTLGYMNIGHSIATCPALLSYGVKSRILPRLRLLESWGFTYREAAAMAVRFPALFNYCAVNNLQCKYEYLIEEIGASKKDLLAFPQYFGFSLEHKIRPRHLFAAKLNKSLSLQCLLTPSDAKFSASFFRGYIAPLHGSIVQLKNAASSESPDKQLLVNN